MFKKLPHCDEVFMTYFDRWYDADDRKRKFYKATRPDIFINRDLRGHHADEISPLGDDGIIEVKSRVTTMINAAREDWPNMFDVAEPIDIDWIDAFDRYHDKKRVKAILKQSDPNDFSNDFIVRCCEFGAVLGHVMTSTQPNLHWIYDWPYWESSIFDPESGRTIAVFHWAIKKF